MHVDASVNVDFDLHFENLACVTLMLGLFGRYLTSEPWKLSLKASTAGERLRIKPRRLIYDP